MAEQLPRADRPGFFQPSTLALPPWVLEGIACWGWVLKSDPRDGWGPVVWDWLIWGVLAP